VRCKSLLAVRANVTVQSLLRSSSCRTVYVAPPTSVTSSVTSSRTCRPHIGGCDRRWADKAVAERCLAGPVSYVHAGLHAFRNRACAHCNYVNDTYVSCDVTSASAPAADDDLDAWRTVATVDLNRRRSAINYVTHNHEAVYDLPRCQPQHVFDPFSQHCRHVPSLLLTPHDTGAEYSVTVVNASSDDSTHPRRHHRYSLYAVTTSSERLTALLASIISLVALIVVVVVYSLRPALRAAVHGQTVLALVTTLLLRQLLYILVVPLVDLIGRAPVTCFCLSVGLHYVSLTSACWLNALAVSCSRREKCRSFARGCGCATSAGLPVVVGMVLLTTLRLDGADAGPACPWTLGLGQLMLHTMLLVIVAAINCVLYVVVARRDGRLVTGSTAGCVSVLLTLVLMTDAALTVAAAVLPQSACVVNLSLAMHAGLGPLVCLSTLLPVCWPAHSCLRRRHR